MSATVVVHPACQWRMDLYEMCLLAGLHGLIIRNVRGRSGRSWLVLSRAKVAM